MSEETAATPENSPDTAAESAPRARRVSTPRPKKVAKVAKVAAEPTSEPVTQVVEKQEPVEAPEPKSSENDWPEPEAASTGNPSQSEGTKRKRRRRKGKGGKQEGAQNFQENASAPVADHGDAPEPLANQAPRPPVGPQQQVKGQQPAHQQHQQQQRPKIDPEILTKMAWKIYLAEVSEEGVALIGDNDAKDLARRCYRLAEIFAEEQSRRR